VLQTLLTTLVVVLGPFQGAALNSASDGSPNPGPTTEVRQATPSNASPVRWALVPEESEARYRVREQLAGLDFPNDAVGVTKEIAGSLVLDAENGSIGDGSEFRIQLASLTTDSERRDGYVRRRTLEVQDFPEAVLVPLRFLDHPVPFPETGSASFRLEADLTLHGETRTTLWDITCDFGADVITGLATTAFPFNTFGITIPQVARVLSVDNNIRLELEFKVVPESR
jgi:polyisoprenoid-binding protein YceI